MLKGYITAQNDEKITLMGRSRNRRRTALLLLQRKPEGIRSRPLRFFDRCASWDEIRDLMRYLEQTAPPRSVREMSLRSHGIGKSIWRFILPVNPLPQLHETNATSRGAQEPEAGSGGQPETIAAAPSHCCCSFVSRKVMRRVLQNDKSSTTPGPASTQTSGELSRRKATAHHKAHGSC